MSTTIANPLNSLERATLRKCERTIQQGQETFREVGLALATVRDGELYREEYKSFRAYCEAKWNFSRQRADQLMIAAQVSHTPPKPTSTTGCRSSEGYADPQEGYDLPTPATERQVRELAKLPEDQRAAAWADAVEEAGGGQPTAAQVKEVVERYAADNEPFVDEEPEGEQEQEQEAPPPPSKSRGKKKPKPGQQKRDPRIWKEIEQHLGKALNRVDELHRAYPNKPMHFSLGRQIKQAMKTLEGWRESVK